MLHRPWANPSSCLAVLNHGSLGQYQVGVPKPTAPKEVGQEVEFSGEMATSLSLPTNTSICGVQGFLRGLEAERLQVNHAGIIKRSGLCLYYGVAFKRIDLSPEHQLTPDGHHLAGHHRAVITPALTNIRPQPAPRQPLQDAISADLSGETDTSA
jgi:hypothetical protein